MMNYLISNEASLFMESKLWRIFSVCGACRYRRLVRFFQEGVYPMATPVPDPEEGYCRKDRLPPGCVVPDLLFFCRRVYDYRIKRLLKNPYWGCALGEGFGEGNYTWEDTSPSSSGHDDEGEDSRQKFELNALIILWPINWVLLDVWTHSRQSYLFILVESIRMKDIYINIHIYINIYIYKYLYISIYELNILCDWALGLKIK